jgi:hypothetical protein
MKFPDSQRKASLCARRSAAVLSRCSRNPQRPGILSRLRDFSLAVARDSRTPVAQRGVALVLTLIMLAIITVVVVVFLATARRNRSSTTVRKDQTDAEFAAETAYQRLGAEIMTNIMGHVVLVGTNKVPDPNLLAFDFFVSAPVGYDVYATNNTGPNAFTIGTTNTRPYLADKIPIVVNHLTNIDVYLDLNRNREFDDPRGTKAPYGDPIWIGILEKPWLPHAQYNRFIARFAYAVIPAGKTLDLNTIHNAVSSSTGEGFKRNQGFGPWELNLAAFLAELNPEVWWKTPNGNQIQYTYGPFPSPIADDNAFRDARMVVNYRSRLANGPVLGLGTVFPQATFPPYFPPSSIDAYSDGKGGNILGANIFAPDDDTLPPSKLTLRHWAGADATNHVFHIQELFDGSKFGQLATNLRHAIEGYAPDNIQADPGAYYRMIAQLNTDAGSDFDERINLNYADKHAGLDVTNFISWDSNAVLAVAFLTNVAQRIYSAQSNELNSIFEIPIRSMTEIPVYPTNRYTTAIHRILQEAANIFDATRTNDYPSVFRPVFGPGPMAGVNYIVGYTNDDRESTLQAWLDRNTNGIPMVVGAKKGFPNFNEFTLRTDILLTRKLQVTRPDTIAGTKPNGTNQMYVLGVSNYFGAEAWNSYDYKRAGPYPRPVTITVSNFVTTWLRNDLGFQTSAVFRVVGKTNYAARSWAGGVDTNAFRLPLNANQVFLSNAVYLFGPNTFAPVSLNVFEPTTGFPLPRWVLTVSNRLSYVMEESGRITDFVLLNDNQVVDLYSDLIGAKNPYANAGTITAAIAGLWSTNRSRPDAPTDGIVQQILVSVNDIGAQLGNGEWAAFSPTSNPNDKVGAMRAFRNFLSLRNPGDPALTNTAAKEMQTPFNPSVKLAVLNTWQANDPLVHYHGQDLRIAVPPTNHQYLKPLQPAQNVSPSSLGHLNDRYSPWNGSPNKDRYTENSDRAAKDPGVSSSDDWQFPNNKLANVGLLGRIHRGTPWQTIYFKSEPATMASWTNLSADLATNNFGKLFSRTHPTNDWRLADMFTTAIDERTSRGLLSVNQQGVESWSALLSGVVVLSNSLTTAELDARRQYTEMFIEPAGVSQTLANWPDLVTNTAFGRLWKSINNYQTNLARPLRSVGDLLQVPELTVRSPFLNQTGNQPKWGLDDFAYEQIPQQILSLLRIGQSRFVIYAYGQALRPTDIDPANGTVRNYQITAEYATRTVVRVEGDPRSRVRMVVESFNILPPD